MKTVKVYSFLSLVLSSNAYFINKSPRLIGPRVTPSMSLNYEPSNVIKTMGSQISQQWSYSDFLDNVRSKHIEAVSILGNNKGFIAIDNLHETSDIQPENLHAIQSSEQLNQNLIDTLVNNHIDFDILNTPATSNNPALGFLSMVLQLGLSYIVLGTVIGFIFRFMSGGGGGGGGGGGMNPFARLQGDIEVIDNQSIKTRFEDVAGIDTIKNELVEIVDYLKSPLKYESAGAKVPKGVLLEGSPGVGKTLLAKAVAGEAGVPFISISGSSFVEMYVGVGAARVRKLFDKAREQERCIIFIDEIDAVGKQRGSSGLNGGNDEREQTLNQLLTELDGFEERPGIIILAATNRIDLLDSALTRPGRFDRKISVPLPNFEARKKIINIHCRGKTISKEVSIDEIASLSSGFSGADIQNLLNEAAILSVRDDQDSISTKNILDAFEKIQIGLPTDNSNLDEEVKELVAYHEAGHSLCSLYFENSFNFSKATIRATSNGAGGYTLFTPEEKYNMYPNKKYMLARLVISLGGRAGESVLYNSKNLENDDLLFQDNDYEELYITAGASGDLETANMLATNYITRWGFSDDFLYYTSTEDSFDSRTSEATKDSIDVYKRRLISDCYTMAKKILSDNFVSLEFIANYLIANQTIAAADLPPLNIKYQGNQ